MTEGKYNLILANGSKVPAEFKSRTPELLPDALGTMHYKIQGINMRATIYSDPKKNKLIFEKA